MRLDRFNASPHLPSRAPGEVELTRTERQESEPRDAADPFDDLRRSMAAAAHPRAGLRGRDLALARGRIPPGAYRWATGAAGLSLFSGGVCTFSVYAAAKDRISREEYIHRDCGPIDDCIPRSRIEQTMQTFHAQTTGKEYNWPLLQRTVVVLVSEAASQACYAAWKACLAGDADDRSAFEADLARRYRSATREHPMIHGIVTVIIAGALFGVVLGAFWLRARKHRLDVLPKTRRATEAPRSHGPAETSACASSAV